ncbi:hypothetical protein BDR05DRAFT_951753 [Suillus weaverae]|nr:hypothetical protein BDR05DRAFT_951753 [Suillus weaverae]
MQASAPPPTSEMLKKAPSTPILTPPPELVGTTHVCVASSPHSNQHTSWRSPSSPPFTSPLPQPSSKPEIAVSHAGSSKKRWSDEHELDSDISFEYVAPVPTKRSKRDRQSLQSETGESDKNTKK